MLKRLSAVLLLLAAGCNGGGQSAPQSIVLRLTNDVSTASFSGELAGILGQAVPNLQIRLVDVHGSEQAVAAVENGTADLTIASGADTYFASGTRFRGVAILPPVIVRFVVRAKTNPRARSASAPMAVWIGPLESSAQLSDFIFQAFDVDPRAIRRVQSSGDEAVASFAAGTIDALLCGTDCPDGLDLVTPQEAKLVSIADPIDRLRHGYPFMRLVRMPERDPDERASAYTVGIDTVLLCRQDLDEPLVYELTRQVIEARTKLPLARLMTLEEAPATPVRLHAGAARYYREWELMR